MFILFDKYGERTEEGRHVKSKAALERAKARKSKDKARHTHDNAAVIKPTLDEEVKLFKAVCRYIVNNDLQDDQRTWFRMEKE